jgi:Protein of unknown function (DUF2442)
MEFFKYKATEVWFTDTEIFVKLNTGEISSLPISNFPLLLEATNSQRENVEIINGYALYWPNLEEDLSVAGFFENVLV